MIYHTGDISERQNNQDGEMVVNVSFTEGDGRARGTRDPAKQCIIVMDCTQNALRVMISYLNTNDIANC